MSLHEYRSPDDLETAAAENLVEHASWAARRTAGMRVDAKSELVLVDSGLPCDNFNVVCRARLAVETAARSIATVVGYFAEVDRPYSWWVCPGDAPADLGTRLEAAGLRQVESEVAMAVDLEALPDVEMPRDLEIRRARSTEDFRDFATTLAAGWSPPDPDVVRYYELTASALLGADVPVWLYVGYVAGVPVATAEVTVGGDVAGLYNVSTLATYRRRGIGTALCRRCLLDARTRGYRVAILQAQGDEGLRIYGRLGFRAFGEIAEYKC